MARYPLDSDPAGIYLHVPFCKGRCRYCGFVSYPHRPDVEESYVQALLREIDVWSSSAARDFLPGTFAFDTLYFGGGTPSLVSPDRIRGLIRACREAFLAVDPLEITMEVNPATCSRSALEELSAAGVNRISLGVQSLNDAELRLMGRPHTAAEALAAFGDLRAVGFDNISVDLMAGYPGQSPSSLAHSLNTILLQKPEHVSVYLLEVKPGTDLETLIREGAIPEPDDDLAADLYEYLCRTLVNGGYQQYEISNFARNGRLARHNLKYWQDVIYLGLGAGAHGMTGRHRYANLEDLEQYGQAVAAERMPFGRLEELAPETRFKDALIMGSRLVAGVDLVTLGGRYGLDALAFVRETIGDLEDAGLYRLDGRRLSLTPKGRLLSNIVFSRWI